MRGRFNLHKFVLSVLLAVTAFLFCICLMNVFDDTRVKLEALKKNSPGSSTIALQTAAAKTTFTKDANAHKICQISDGLISRALLDQLSTEINRFQVCSLNGQFFRECWLKLPRTDPLTSTIKSAAFVTLCQQYYKTVLLTKLFIRAPSNFDLEHH